MKDQLQHFYESIFLLIPEVIISGGLLLTLVLGLITATNKPLLFRWIILISFGISIYFIFWNFPAGSTNVFGGMMHSDAFSSYFKILFLAGGILGVLMHNSSPEKESSEYYIFIYAIVLGSCLLAASVNFIMVLLSLELISLSSYLLTGFGFNKSSSEGSLKYFLFGSVATACSIYGLSILYGFSGTLDFTTGQFARNLIELRSPLLLVGALLTLAGFLFKIAAAPFHLWAPDVYESAPTSVVAFISVVPKLAGIAVLTRFILAITLFGQSGYDWQSILAIISIISISIGNLSALSQNNPKRMMAYSSVAQAGFLLIGLVTFSQEGIYFMMFYSTVFLAMNFLVFHTLSQFELNGRYFIPSFAGLGTQALIPSIVILIGLIALTGLPPTAGFTAKFFLFGSLWVAYQQNSSTILLILFIVGLINTVISLFFYLKIPYYLFVKERTETIDFIKTGTASNLFSLILVIVLFYLFINPDGLMGWINKVTFGF